MDAARAALLAMHAHERTGGLRRIRDWVQRLVNFVIAALLLLLLSPLLLVLAAAIAWSDGFPVTYGHLRVSQHGRLFRCLKFRTMYRDSDRMLARLLARNPAAAREWERDQKLTNDPRVTPIGSILRRTSLDELPQLFNVLRGDMSLVGPRPVTARELARYGPVRWQYLSVTPGMTGLWQVSGRNNTSYQERVALDKRYVLRRSLWLDLRILLRTVRVVLRGEGAR